MPLDCRNTNTLWASILAEILNRLGLRTAIICPGSRSTPLAFAFAQQSQETSKHPLETIPILDERSAAFFALGIARKSGFPVVLICTSGTAGANFYPAVIEARESRVPLLILTADRPPELRNCHSGQTIDQVKLYGNYPNWQAELAVPSVDLAMLRYLRQTLVYAWERSLFPSPGPVHLNIPFRDPLAPLPDPAINGLISQFELEDFLRVAPSSPSHVTGYSSSIIPYQQWQECQEGIIIAGPSQPQNPRQYCAAIGQLSKTLEWPVLAEGLSPLRNYAELNPYLISTYDLILRNPQLAKQLAPKMVIHMGELPISKELRHWLDECQPQRWVIDPSDQNLDPLHGQTTHLRLRVEDILNWDERDSLPLTNTPQTPTNHYLTKWCETEAKVRTTINETMANLSLLFEGKAAWLLSQHLPPSTPLFIANSMPVRDVEFFWCPGNTGIQPYFNRGANGIDGTLSTALGIAHHHQSTVMLTGDLALLHDTNGFLLTHKLMGHLTIILINNRGGGIFEMLPISQFDPPFEEFFATPQSVNFAQLCLSYGVDYQSIESWDGLIELLNPLPSQGVRVLELQTDRKADARWRQEFFRLY